MEDRQQRKWASFARVLALPTQWPKQMSDPQVAGTLEELQATNDAVATLELRKIPLRGKTARATEIKNWSRALREDHLMVLKTVASVHLKDESGKPMRLKVPHFKAKTAAVLEAAKEFNERLQPVAHVLIAKKINADFLDRMNDAAKQLSDWQTKAADGRQEHKALRAEMNALISKGRKLILLLRRFLGAELERNSVFKTQFEKAAMVEPKTGVPRSKANTKKERVPYRKRPKQPRGRPTRL